LSADLRALFFGDREAAALSAALLIANPTTLGDRAGDFVLAAVYELNVLSAVMYV
jgi:hypothetical protein